MYPPVPWSRSSPTAVKVKVMIVFSSIPCDLRSWTLAGGIVSERLAGGVSMDMKGLAISVTLFKPCCRSMLIVVRLVARREFKTLLKFIRERAHKPHTPTYLTHK